MIPEYTTNILFVLHRDEIALLFFTPTDFKHRYVVTQNYKSTLCEYHPHTHKMKLTTKQPRCNDGNKSLS